MMLFLKFARWSVAVLFFAGVLAACGGSDDASAPETTEPVAEVEEVAESDTTEPETTESEPAESQIEEPAGIDPVATVDDRTDEERAIDRLDVMLVQLRVEDLVATADCVIERLDEEGIELVGQGAPEIAATLACDRTAGNELFSPASFDLPEADGECVVEGLIDAVIMVPLAEAEAFFSADTPPADVLEAISGDCGVTLEQLNQGFS